MDPIAADDLFAVLLRFHREIALPDIERTIRDPLDARISALDDRMLTNFDAVYARFDRLEAEHASLKAAVRRLEER